MKATHRLFTAVFLFAVLQTAAQKKDSILLQSGWVPTVSNISGAYIENFNRTARREKSRAFVVLQFDAIPNEGVKKSLAAQGIILHEYLPNNAFTATISGNLRSNSLQAARVRSIVSLTPQQKMHSSLWGLQMPHWAVRQAGTVDVMIVFPRSFSAAEVVGLLQEKNISIVSRDLEAYQVLTLRIAVNRLTELAAYPFVTFVEPVSPEPEPLNYNNRWASGALILNQATALGGKGLNGEGVAIGIGDNADVQFHPDFYGRLINRSTATYEGHGTHVTGIAAGAGNINEQLRGYASKATIISQYFNGILTNTPVYVKDHNMVITNNSYSAIAINCETFGIYNISSYLIDQQAFDLPHLQHVFAAGNSGNASCNIYLPGYGSVLGGFQSAKNVISVGAATHLGVLWPKSSKGPVKDGRVKPDITAMGAAVLSTYPASTYTYDWGTSMAAPSVSGALALMYQRYRQLNGGSDPKSALMKALLCNGATDLGNAGPDYAYGFGFMDVRRSIDMLEKNHYATGQLAAGGSRAHSITVPANTAMIKATLYWHDPPASVLGVQTLVNDLDLSIVTPSSGTMLPKVLDATPAMITQPAGSGADHTNNMEQVVLENPEAGTYTLQVNATRIAQNPFQEYYVVYDIVPATINLRYPLGNMNVAAGENVAIQWDAFDNQPNTFTLQWSSDNGATWTDIATTVPAAQRYYDWTAPSIASEQVRVRVLRNGTALSSSSQSFAILGVPSISLSSTQCEGYIKLDWTAVAGATGYELMMLSGDEMKTVATTNALTYTWNSLSKDSTYWVTVRAILNGNPGRRAVALSRKPENGNCSNSISDNDLKLDAILSPVSGRKFTSTALQAATPVRVSVKNLDDMAAAGFTMSYSVNGGPWNSEPVAMALAPGAVYTHNFSIPFDFSAIGSYELKAVVTNLAADAATRNDTLTTIIKQLANDAVDLSSGFLDDLEQGNIQSYLSPVTGLEGLDRYDYDQSAVFGRLRTFVNSGFSYTGTKAITMDRTRNGSTPKSINYFTGTFNLSAYDALTDDVRLDFFFNNPGGNYVNDNRVWIRANDTLPWIEVYNMDVAKWQGYNRSASIEMSDSLMTRGQQFSSSFQVRWSQSGVSQATSPEFNPGISIDNIHLYKAVNDLAVVQIDTPKVVACGLNNTTPIMISVRNNSHQTLTNIPVKFGIDNIWTTETIPSIPGNTTITYTFNTKADLSKNGLYSLVATVNYPTDNFRNNDTVGVSLRVLPLVTSFPHIENFEQGEGGWFAEGTNASWNFGTPASPKIGKAASGIRAWKTNLTANYNDMERSYLMSPCYQIAGMSQPTLSFSMAMDLEDCGSTLCDGMWIEYTVDDENWYRLLPDSAFNFYDSIKTYWSKENDTRWHVVTAGLPRGFNRVRLRFALFSDEAVNREGIGIDDIHIYDRSVIHDGSTVAVPAKNISGAGWQHFEKDGKLVASVNPGNQSLGATTASAYIFADSVRYEGTQYYHGRNLVIQPAKTHFDDSVSIRFYFLEQEIQQLVAASNCASCDPVNSAYELGVAKYSELDDAAENGTVADNLAGSWDFIPRDHVAIVPFDKGYYAEFKVKTLSELWLRKAAFAVQIPHSVTIRDFHARKDGSNVAVDWQVSSEVNVNHYEIELAKGNSGMQQNQFQSIGSVVATNQATQSYNFADLEDNKSGVRYYRLKIVFKDGSVQYSEIKPVVFSQEMEWLVFPNPSDGIFQLQYQGNAGTSISGRLIDATGRVIRTFTLETNGFVQKFPLNLAAYNPGVYLLQLHDGETTRVYKLFRK